MKIFAEEFELPVALRPFVWKVILGILPMYQESIKFIKGHRRGQYDDLNQGLKHIRLTMKLLRETPLPENIQIMYLLEKGALNFIHKNMFESIPVLESMSEVVSSMIRDPCDAYWITKCMYETQSSFEPVFAKLPKYVKYYIHLEDKRLFEHLCEVELFKILPYDHWFRTYFTPVFCESKDHLEKIWDKLVAGCCNILVFVLVAILLTFSIQLKEKTSPEEALEVVRRVPKYLGVVVVDKTMELWDHYRKSLTVDLANHSFFSTSSSVC